MRKSCAVERYAPLYTEATTEGPCWVLDMRFPVRENGTIRTTDWTGQGYRRTVSEDERPER